MVHFVPLAGKSGYLELQQTTGRADTRPTGAARWSGSCRALDRLAVRQISPRYLSQDERIEIADLRRAG